MNIYKGRNVIRVFYHYKNNPIHSPTIIDIFEEDILASHGKAEVL